MDDAHHTEISPVELRERAMAVLAARCNADNTSGTETSTGAGRDQTLHELLVHQVELEMQNEELRRTQLELEASRRRWFELYDLAPVGYCTVNQGGLVLQANLAAAEMLRQPRAALVQRRLSDFIERGDQPAYYGVLGQLLGTGLPQSCELRLAHANGTERWVQFAATVAEPDEQGGRTLRIVMLDVTARRQAQAAEGELRLAEQTHRSRIEFLSRVSHEFRTPLNAIIGFSHMLLLADGAAPGPSARRQQQHVLDAGKHLLELVNDLLDLTAAESGRLAVRSDTMDALAVLRDAVSQVAAQAQAASVTVVLEAPLAPVALVSADARRLLQVVENLLTNAIKYNRVGGHVAVRVTRHGEYWRVCVADNGIGMTPQQQAALFQPFNRLGRENSGLQGTGLGLVITRELVQAMGGRLTMRSEAGVGSEFFVELLARYPEPDGATPSGDSSAQARTAVAGRVLCVEDDPATHELIRAILAQRPGVQLEIVQTGAQCTEAARRAWPDLLLLDLRLPDMPGLDVLKVLRQRNPHLPLRCLVVSASASAEDIERARAACADDFVSKPVDPELLLSMIDRLLVG